MKGRERDGWVGGRDKFSREFQLETEALARLHAPSCHVIMRELSYPGFEIPPPLSRRKKKGGCGETSRKRSGSLKSRASTLLSDNNNLRVPANLIPRYSLRVMGKIGLFDLRRKGVSFEGISIFFFHATEPWTFEFVVNRRLRNYRG